MKEKELLVVEDVAAAQGEAAATRKEYREVDPGVPMEGDELELDRAKKVAMAKEVLSRVLVADVAEQEEEWEDVEDSDDD